MSVLGQLDEVDLAIIRKLQADGRQSYASIASELNLAPSTVQMRANRLIDDGILAIQGMVHPADLGDVMIAMVAIKADGTRLQKVAAELSALEEVRWVVICAGQYDILTEIICKNSKHLLSILSNKLAALEGIRETVTFPYLDVLKRAYEWGLPESLIQLDEADETTASEQHENDHRS